MATAILCLAVAVGAPDDFASVLRRADSVRSADPAQFKELLRELDTRQAEATTGQAQLLRYLNAYRLAYTGRYDAAIEQASALFDETDDPRLRFRTGALIANSHAVTRDFAAGLSYLDRILALRGEIEDAELLHDGLLVASTLYNQVGQHELGRDYAAMILESSQATARARCFAGYLHTEALFNLDELPADEASILAAIDSCEGTNELLVANFGRVYLARKRASDGSTGQAIELLEDRLAEVDAIAYPRLTGEVHSLLGEYRLAQGDVERAAFHAQRAIDNSSGIEFSLPLVAAYRTLYEVSMRRGDKASALEHYRKFADADKAYLDIEKARELAFQLARHEALQKNQMIELLNKQNQVLQLEKQVSAQDTRNTQLLAVLLAVLLAFIGYWAFKTKRVQIAMRRLSESDSLTRISNRRHFTQQAEAALRRCEKAGGEVALVMFDLDHFKYINDLYGHATGDWVLERVAAVASTVCRKHDDIGRLGGEEFAILLADCDPDTAAELAGRCRERIAAIDTGASGHDFKVTASFGVAGTATAGYALDPLLAQADQALYRSKREGRDRVSAFGPADEASAAAVDASPASAGAPDLSS